MRTFALVAVLTVLTAVLLARTPPSRPTTDALVSSLTVPAEAFAGERLSVRGSVLLPGDDVLERRFRFCHVEAGACSTAGWGTVSGPGHWTGFAGDLRTVETGTYRVTWTLHAPWGSDTTRAASRVEAEVTVRAAPD